MRNCNQYYNFFVRGKKCFKQEESTARKGALAHFLANYFLRTALGNPFKLLGIV